VTSTPLHRAGTARILAIADARRAAAVPDVPTFAEAGLDDFRSITWFACVAPPGTPATTVARINRDLLEILRRPDVHATLTQAMLEPVGSTPAETALFLRAETALWGKLVRDTGAKAQ